jgi:ribosome-associated protein
VTKADLEELPAPKARASRKAEVVEAFDDAPQAAALEPAPRVNSAAAKAPARAQGRVQPKKQSSRPQVPGETGIKDATDIPVAKRDPSPNDGARRAFAIDAARMLHDDKCTDIVLLDVRALSGVADYIIIGSGTSDRQMRSVLKNVRELGEARGMPAWRTSEDDGSLWLLADLVDVVVHLFEPNTRSHYDLEMLWGDAPRVEWERPEQKSRDLAGLGRSAVRGS